MTGLGILLWKGLKKSTKIACLLLRYGACPLYMSLERPSGNYRKEFVSWRIDHISFSIFNKGTSAKILPKRIFAKFLSVIALQYLGYSLFYYCLPMLLHRLIPLCKVLTCIDSRLISRLYKTFFRHIFGPPRFCSNNEHSMKITSKIRKPQKISFCCCCCDCCYFCCGCG